MIAKATGDGCVVSYAFCAGDAEDRHVQGPSSKTFLLHVSMDLCVASAAKRKVHVTSYIYILYNICHVLVACSGSIGHAYKNII